MTCEIHKIAYGIICHIKNIPYYAMSTKRKCSGYQVWVKYGEVRTCWGMFYTCCPWKAKTEAIKEIT